MESSAAVTQAKGPESPQGEAPLAARAPAPTIRRRLRTDPETLTLQALSAGKLPSITCCPAQTQVTGAQVS